MLGVQKKENIQYNDIKDCLMQQTSGISERPSIPSSSAIKNTNSQSDYKKYLHHFESINTTPKIPPAFIHSVENNKNKYGEAIQLYATSLSASIIDQIADSPVKQSHVKVQDQQFEDFVHHPIVGNFNPRVKQRVNQINRFFSHNRWDNDRDDIGVHDDANLNGYIRNIINIDMKNAISRPLEQSPIRNVSRSRSKQSIKTPIIKNVHTVSPAPPKVEEKAHQFHEVEVNTDPQPQFSPSISPTKLKKIDLILIQIMKQKKRKGLVPDYFRAIQMKLVQLLEYILQDEHQYFGLSLKQKMKEVLNNLEGFKGKTVDGQSKVNMLRIFFEEFRILKKQRDEELQIEGRQNRSKSHSKKSNSKAQSKNSVINEGYQTQSTKKKKDFDTQSLGASHPQQKLPPKKKPSSKSVKEEDQWIGTLDN